MIVCFLVMNSERCIYLTTLHRSDNIIKELSKTSPLLTYSKRRQLDFVMILKYAQIEEEQHFPVTYL